MFLLQVKLETNEQLQYEEILSPAHVLSHLVHLTVTR